jgi:hypothetical protein
VPAQQQLDTIAVAAAGIDQRLAVDHKFVSGDAIADLRSGVRSGLAALSLQHYAVRPVPGATGAQYPAVSGIVPAQQQLDTIAVAAAGIDQRLAVDHKFVSGDAHQASLRYPYSITLYGPSPARLALNTLPSQLPLAGCNPALARIVPAQQQLDTIAVAAAGIDQRLAVDHSLQHYAVRPVPGATGAQYPAVSAAAGGTAEPATGRTGRTA